MGIYGNNGTMTKIKKSMIKQNLAKRTEGSKIAFGQKWYMFVNWAYFDKNSKGKNLDKWHKL